METLSTINNQYLVKAQDSLEKIAHQLLGDVANWRDIANKNQIDIFKRLPIGSNIDIPTIDEITQVFTPGSFDNSILDLSGLRTANVSGQNPYQLIEWIL